MAAIKTPPQLGAEILVKLFFDHFSPYQWDHSFELEPKVNTMISFFIIFFLNSMISCQTSCESFLAKNRILSKNLPKQRENILFGDNEGLFNDFPCLKMEQSLETVFVSASSEQISLAYFSSER